MLAMATEPTPSTPSPSQTFRMPLLPNEGGGINTSPEQEETIKTLSLVIVCLCVSTLLFFVSTIYYCGRYGMCKNGLFPCCVDDEYRSHTGFISLANDIDLDEDDEV